mgnify:CR=1 FL=1
MHINLAHNVNTVKLFEICERLSVKLLCFKVCWYGGKFCRVVSTRAWFSRDFSSGFNVIISY